MSLFSRGADDDTERLRRALVLALERVAEGAEERDRARLDRVIARLDRPGVPSGLVREVGIALEQALDDEPSTLVDEGPGVAAEVARALVDALRDAALLDQEVHQAIAALSDRVPPQVGRGDARRIVTGAEAVRVAAGPARERQVAARAEIRALVEGLAADLKPADRSCKAIDWGLSELSGTLSSSHEPEAFAAMRADLLSIARDLSGSAASLRAQLGRVNERVEALEAELAEADRSLSEARDAAERDGLTGLVNRATFDRTLLESVRRSRDGEGGFSLVLIDVDHFKRVNDTHGHPAGDEVLQRLAARLGTLVRGGDLVARIGGEEFAVLLRGVEVGPALEIVERFRENIEGEGFESERGPFSVTVSLGVATHDGSEGGLSLYKRADRALYEAKGSGRNRVVLAA